MTFNLLLCLIIIIVSMLYIHVHIYTETLTQKKYFTLSLIKDRNIYEIKKGESKFQKQIIINEEYVLDTPDIEYYNQYEEYQKRLQEYNLPQLVQIQQPQLVQIQQPEQIQNFNIDNQNVHNSTIQKIIKKKYNTLDNEINVTNVTNEINKWDPSIMNIVRQIEKRNSPISNLNGETEMDILTKVWLNTKDDNEKNAIIIELKESLNSDGNIYCPTGVATRLVNATYINNPEEMPKTKSMIHNEMMNTASAMRDSLEKDDNFKGINEDEQIDLFKDSLINKYKKDYSEILTDTEIKDMTSEWIDLI